MNIFFYQNALQIHQNISHIFHHPQQILHKTKFNFIFSYKYIINFLKLYSNLDYIPNNQNLYKLSINNNSLIKYHVLYIYFPLSKKNYNRTNSYWYDQMHNNALLKNHLMCKEILDSQHNWLVFIKNILINIFHIIKHFYVFHKIKFLLFFNTKAY